MQSYLSNLGRWEKTDPKRRGRAPKPPRSRPHLTAHAQMAQVHLGDYRQGFVRLKVFTGRRLEWTNYPVAPPYFSRMLEESDLERARITALRAEQNRRLAAQGRRGRTEAEKRALQPTPGLWVAQSPTLVQKPDGWWLHMPLIQRVPIAGKAEDRRKAEPDLKVGTVDLNADSAVAAAWEGQTCRGTKTVWHGRENAKRGKALQKIARRQKQSGRPVNGERSNGGLWRSIAHLDAAVAWQVAAALVAWAVASGLAVLVFEYLRPYRPQRGLSWSRRTNRKRASGLRGQVLAHARHLAPCHGILVVEWNPAWTSQACPHCSHLGERFSRWARLSQPFPVRARWLDGRCEHRGRPESEAELPVSHRAGEAGSRNESSPQGGRSCGGQRQDQDNDGCPRGRMPLRLVPGGADPWWGWLLIPRACASGLPREAPDSQWPADPTQASWGRPLPGNVGRVQGRPAQAGLGRHEWQMSRFVRQIGQLLTPPPLDGDGAAQRDVSGRAGCHHPAPPTHRPPPKTTAASGAADRPPRIPATARTEALRPRPAQPGSRSGANYGRAVRPLRTAVRRRRRLRRA